MVRFQPGAHTRMSHEKIPTTESSEAPAPKRKLSMFEKLGTAVRAKYDKLTAYAKDWTASMLSSEHGDIPTKVAGKVLPINALSHIIELQPGLVEEQRIQAELQRHFERKQELQARLENKKIHPGEYEKLAEVLDRKMNVLRESMTQNRLSPQVQEFEVVREELGAALVQKIDAALSKISDRVDSVGKRVDFSQEQFKVIYGLIQEAKLKIEDMRKRSSDVTPETLNHVLTVREEKLQQLTALLRERYANWEKNYSKYSVIKSKVDTLRAQGERARYLSQPESFRDRHDRTMLAAPRTGTEYAHALEQMHSRNGGVLFGKDISTEQLQSYLDVILKLSQKGEGDISLIPMLGNLRSRAWELRLRK